MLHKDGSRPVLCLEQGLTIVLMMLLFTHFFNFHAFYHHRSLSFYLLCVLLFRVYIVCPLSVLLHVLANKDVHYLVSCCDCVFAVCYVVC